VRTRTQAIALATVWLLGVSTIAVAQGQQPPPAGAQQAAQPSPPRPLVSLKVQVVISRYQGEKKLSSLPYSLAVTANSRPSSLRMGAQVPIEMTSWPSNVPADAPVMRGPVSYRDIGTKIDADASSLDEGRFRIQVTINDTSVYTEGQTAAGTLKLNVPTFRTFESSETLVLKDGQSSQFTAATDKVSGEVTRVDVTLTVVK
jgi:hypothetical protein